jgi:hypothetical protein
MRALKVLLAIMTFTVCLVASHRGESPPNLASSASFQTKSDQAAHTTRQPNSLCAKTEHIIFSCLVKRAGKGQGLTKIASLCASADLDKDHGYLQYRFGLPGKVELEFPDSRTGTQQKFQYTHYLRYQVDLTEINFAIDDYQYQIFDDYNGEEKPRIATQGVNVSAPGKTRDVSYVCRGKVTADYSKLDDVLPREP